MFGGWVEYFQGWRFLRRNICSMVGQVCGLANVKVVGYNVVFISTANCIKFYKTKYRFWVVGYNGIVISKAQLKIALFKSCEKYLFLVLQMFSGKNKIQF